MKETHASVSLGVNHISKCKQNRIGRYHKRCEWVMRAQRNDDRLINRTTEKQNLDQKSAYTNRSNSDKPVRNKYI